MIGDGIKIFLIEDSIDFFVDCKGEWLYREYVDGSGTHAYSENYYLDFDDWTAYEFSDNEDYFSWDGHREEQ